MYATFLTAQKEGPDFENSEPAKPHGRPKRHQVARACAWCRTYRIKCDANYPCRNCKAKGRMCTVEQGKEEVRTFPRAIKEIDRLKERIKELESKLQNLDVEEHSVRKQDESPSSSQRIASLPVNLDPFGQHGSLKKCYNWDIIRTRNDTSRPKTYGPSSSHYFLKRMTSYLEGTVQYQYPCERLECDVKNSAEVDENMDELVRQYPGLEERELSRADEEALLEIYWMVYHPIYSILDEEEVKAHYDALWSAKRTSRQASALVDIMLAVCMQYSAALPTTNARHQSPTLTRHDDASTAGKWLHRRGQNLLTDELEEPSLQTFQCHFLSVLWLSNSDSPNMAHSIMGAGLRTGIILGLYLEPSEELPIAQREFRKRLWWTMYALEMKFAMELGRPLAVNLSQVTCSLPDEEQTLESGESVTHPFNAQSVKLLLAARAIYITFYQKCGAILTASGENDLHKDVKSLEMCAEYLSSKVSYLKTWIQQVPTSLTYPRQVSGSPYSSDGSLLSIPYPSSTETARQSVLLELQYHNLAMSSYRPFITFTRSPGSQNPVTEKHSISCANHAITMTSMIHQLLTSTELLDGWIEGFHWQRTAAMSLIGYIVAYPTGPVAPNARKMLDTALAVLDIYSNNLASARSGTTVIRTLVSKADIIVSLAEAALILGGTTATTVATTSEANMPWIEGIDFSFDDLVDTEMVPESGDGELEVFSNLLADTNNFSFTVDTAVGLEALDSNTPNTGLSFDFLDFGDEEEV